MTTEFNWSVTKLESIPERNNRKDVVTVVHWECVGKQIINGNLVVGNISGMNRITPPGTSFIAYNNLDQNTTLQWVWNIISKSVVENEVQLQINSKTTASTLPW